MSSFILMYLIVATVYVYAGYSWVTSVTRYNKPTGYAMSTPENIHHYMPLHGMALVLAWNEQYITGVGFLIAMLYIVEMTGWPRMCFIRSREATITIDELYIYRNNGKVIAYGLAVVAYVLTPLILIGITR